MLSKPELPIIRVSEAIAFCNTLFSEVHFLIEGEIANFNINRGKFVFFDLKDEEQEARLSCFMMSFQLSIPLEDGMRVVIEGRPGIYQKSGGFRLTVSKVEPKGEGSVKRAFELLRAKLEAEGLFASERKRLLPRFVQEVGLISSADAAGFGDFIKIAKSRMPGVKFRFVNVAVQGRNAETEICQAFEYLNSYFQLDALVLIRGGGSMEDLHAFNSEQVARAIVRSKAPVLVGVGHERDITIADFCADLRAATPSNAAQLLLPTLEEVKEQVLRLTQDGRRRIERVVQTQKEKTIYSFDRLHQVLLSHIQQQRLMVSSLLKTIEALSPQSTLERGFSLTCNAQGKPIHQASELKKGEIINTQFAKGKISSKVT